MREFIVLSVSGIVAGFVNGFFGTGGGLVIFYVLLYLGGDVKKSLATANFGILILSVSAFLIYIKNGTLSFEKAFDFLKNDGGWVVAGGCIGGAAATVVSPTALKKVFSLLVLLCGARMVTQ